MVEELSKKNRYDLLYLSLVGSKIKIINSKNSNQISVEGVLFRESAKMLYLEVNGEIKRFMKDIVQIEVYKGGKALKMDGRLLLSTLKSRIKKLK